MATAAEIQTAYKAIYRTDLNATVAQAIANSGISLDAYIAQQLPQVAATTQAAVAIASFVTGTTPTTAKLDALKVEADKQVASYTALGVGNPSLGAYEAFGRSFATDTETTAAFNTKYGALSTADFIAVVYAQVYGTQPSAGAAANLTAQINYFTNLYTANGVANAALAAKGAVLGQIVGYAFTSSASANSALDNQVASVLTSAAKGDTTVYAKALPAVVDPGSVGVTITLAGGVNQVSTTAADPAFRSTSANDTINAVGGTFTDGTKIDAGAGSDTLNALLTNNTKVSASGVGAVTATLTSVEILRVDGNGFTLDTKGITGVTDIVVTDNDAALDATTITNLTSGIALSLNKANGAVAFGFGTTEAVAATTIKVADSTAATLALGGGGQFGAKAVTLESSSNFTSTLSLQDAESLAIKGSGNVSYTLAGANNTALKSVDASGISGKVGLTLTAPANNTTVTLSAQDDIFSSNFSTTKLVTINTGAGADRVVSSAAAENLTFNTDGSLKTGAVVSDFTKGTDKIDLTTIATADFVTGLASTTLTAVNSANTLQEAVTAVLNDAAVTVGKAALFVYGSDTYIAFENGNEGLNAPIPAVVGPPPVAAVAGDGLIKLTGVSGITAGTALTSDILLGA